MRKFVFAFSLCFFGVAATQGSAQPATTEDPVMVAAKDEEKAAPKEDTVKAEIEPSPYVPVKDTAREEGDYEIDED